MANGKSGGSWMGRVVSSLNGVLVGGILFLIAFPLLFWNEGRAIKTYNALIQGASEVVSVSSDVVVEENDGQLVHFTALADTQDVLEDPLFGVRTNAIKLDRVVEMYQWMEETHQDSDPDGNMITTYTYQKVWDRNVIDSTQFYRGGHENPNSMAVPPQTFYAKNVTAGAFLFPENMIQDIGEDEPLPITRDLPLPPMQNITYTDEGGFYIGVAPLPRWGEDASNIPESTPQETNVAPALLMVPSQPTIGDLHVHFQIVHPHKVSLVGRQTDHTLTDFTGESGHSFLLLQDGVHSAEEMFNTAQRENTVFTWVTRFAGLCVMFFGLVMIFKPIGVISSGIPWMGRFVANMVGMGIFFAGFLIAMLLTLFTIAIAWVFYRPVLGLFLLAIVVGLFLYMIKKSRETSQTATASAKNQTKSR